MKEAMGVMALLAGSALRMAARHTADDLLRFGIPLQQTAPAAAPARVVVPIDPHAAAYAAQPVTINQIFQERTFLIRQAEHLRDEADRLRMLAEEDYMTDHREVMLAKAKGYEDEATDLLGDMEWDRHLL